MGKPTTEPMVRSMGWHFIHNATKGLLSAERCRAAIAREMTTRRVADIRKTWLWALAELQTACNEGGLTQKEADKKYSNILHVARLGGTPGQQFAAWRKLLGFDYKVKPQKVKKVETKEVLKPEPIQDVRQHSGYQQAFQEDLLNYIKGDPIQEIKHLCEKMLEVISSGQICRFQPSRVTVTQEEDLQSLDIRDTTAERLLSAGVSLPGQRK